jgi:hypothetical protein
MQLRIGMGFGGDINEILFWKQVWERHQTNELKFSSVMIDCQIETNSLWCFFVVSVAGATGRSFANESIQVPFARHKSFCRHDSRTHHHAIIVVDTHTRNHTHTRPSRPIAALKPQLHAAYMFDDVDATNPTLILDATGACVVFVFSFVRARTVTDAFVLCFCLFMLTTG